MLVPTDWDTIVRGRNRENDAPDVSGMHSDEINKIKVTESTNGITATTKKRKKTATHSAADQAQQSSMSAAGMGAVRSIADVCHNILCGINKTHHTPDESNALQELNLDCVLSR